MLLLKMNRVKSKGQGTNTAKGGGDGLFFGGVRYSTHSEPKICLPCDMPL